jgi:hypothetical protein
LNEGLVTDEMRRASDAAQERWMRSPHMRASRAQDEARGARQFTLQKLEKAAAAIGITSDMSADQMRARFAALESAQLVARQVAAGNPHMPAELQAKIVASVLEAQSRTPTPTKPKTAESAPVSMPHVTPGSGLEAWYLAAGYSRPAEASQEWKPKPAAEAAPTSVSFDPFTRTFTVESGG